MGILGVSAYSQTTNTQNRNNSEQRERERVEKERYDEACKVGTLKAYDSFLSLYPKSKFATDIKERKDDAIAFKKAKNLNTKKAYEDYLNSSILLIYESQAKKALSELVAEVEWDKVKDSLDIKEMESFISKFPHSSYAQTANQRKKLILAIKAYEQEDFSLALQLFNKIGEQIELLPRQKEIHIRVAEEVAFSKLTPNSSQIEYKEFIDKYPKGKYASQVSNWRAINYAKSLRVTDSDSKYTIVRSYARDDKTKKIVEEYIANNERNKTAYYKGLQEKKKQQERVSRREAKRREKEALKRLRRINGDSRFVHFGLGRADVGTNVTISYYNVPILLSLGANYHILQLDLGLKPGLRMTDFSEFDFHMPAFLTLKLTTGSVFDSTRIYVGGIGMYNNLVNEHPLLPDFSYGISIGLLSRQRSYSSAYDDFSLYYLQGVNPPIDENGSRKDIILGLSWTYYF